MTYHIRRAAMGDHAAICAIAKTSQYTRDFSNRLMFSSDAAYEKGWIMVAEQRGCQLLGFTCVRHKVREPVTMLYFITVHPDHRGRSIGERLLRRVMEYGPHDRMKLNVMKENRAVNFYKRLGFVIAGEALDGHAHCMVKDWKQ